MSVILVDRHAKPNIIILETDDAHEAADVAQRYANMTGRKVTVIDGNPIAEVEQVVVIPTDTTATPEMFSLGAVDGGVKPPST